MHDRLRWNGQCDIEQRAIAGHRTTGHFIAREQSLRATLIAGIGCLRGLQTAAGASAVGESATRAVVSGIILLVVVDGLFALAYYMLNI